MSAQKHIAESRRLLDWARRALEFEDLRGASGRAWAAAAEATKAVAAIRNIRCASKGDVHRVAYDFENEIKDEKVTLGFAWAEGLYENSVEGYYHESDVELGIKGVADYVEGVAACLGVGAAPQNDAASNSL